MQKILALAKNENIEVLFLIQPNLFDKLNLTDVEKNILRKIYEYFSVGLIKLAFQSYYETLLEDCKKESKRKLGYKEIQIADLALLKNYRKTLQRTIFYKLHKYQYV